jgi:hypothetical protein
VALESIVKRYNERLVCGEFAGHLRSLEVCELLAERDAWQVLDLPSVAGASERDCEAPVA